MHPIYYSRVLVVSTIQHSPKTWQLNCMYHPKTLVVHFAILHKLSGVDFTKSHKSNINHKCDFQAFDWLKFTLTTDLRFTTFCEIDHRSQCETVRATSRRSYVLFLNTALMLFSHHHHVCDRCMDMYQNRSIQFVERR